MRKYRDYNLHFSNRKALVTRKTDLNLMFDTQVITNFYDKTYRFNAEKFLIRFGKSVTLKRRIKVNL